MIIKQRCGIITRMVKEEVKVMHRILEKETLASGIKAMIIEAPLVARKVKPGQFIILRIHEKGERIPLTVAQFNPEKGTVRIVFQEVGKTTEHLGTLKPGDTLRDFIGPLGLPMEINLHGGRVVCIAGGAVPIFLEAKAYKKAGNEVLTILGARTQELIILEKEMREVSDKVYITTDDGTYGIKGFVTEALKRIIAEGSNVSEVFAVGPIPMMKAVSEITRPYGIKTLVSLNSIMVDGTGMCGTCRVTVGGKMKFTCVDGPTFDGHQVDFDELALRQKRFLAQEKLSLELFRGKCKKEAVVESRRPTKES